MPGRRRSLRQARHVTALQLEDGSVLDLDPCLAFEHEEHLGGGQDPRRRLVISVGCEPRQARSHRAGVEEHMLLGASSDLGVGLPLVRRDLGNEHTRVHFHRSLLACGFSEGWSQELGIGSAAMEASNRQASMGTTDEPRVDPGEHEAEHARLPHLWASRPWPLRILLATVPPALFGSLCGWVLGVSKVAYIILAIPVAILLQLLVGLEHRNRAEAAARGFVAGAFFGGFILIVNQLLIDTEPKFHLQDPKGQLAVVTAPFRGGLARLGAGLRGPPPPPRPPPLPSRGP